jgi:hypothetical protein
MRAKVLNVGEHPCLHAELYSASNNHRDNLTEEHRPRWDLHVVAKLQVAGESKSPIHGIITACLEHHHRNRTARKGVSNNQLGDHVKPNLPVRGGYHDTNRDNEHDG